MNKDTSNFISLDGQEPSNNRANFQLGPLQRFILILRDDFPQLVSDERTQIRYLALESLQQNHPISHMRHQLEADDYLGRFNAEQRGELAYQISQEFAGVWFPPDESAVVQPIQPSADGPPAAQWALLVDSIMQSANVTLDTELGEQWQAVELTIKSMLKGAKAAYDQYVALELSHTDEVFIQQCDWAMKGLQAGMRAAETDQDVTEPKYVWQQSALHRVEVQSFLKLAGDIAGHLYTVQLAKIHRNDMQAKCVSAYWHFAKIGKYIIEHGIEIGGAA